MKLFNSKTQKIETFEPIEKGKVSMYVCGPTVYNHAHIGNARPIVVFDLLRRVLETQGYDVHYVSNYTDVDDKIIEKAIEKNQKESEIAQKYIEAYDAIRHALNADVLDATPQVTENMDRIIAFIQNLIQEKKAYEINGNVYFRVSEIEDYGEISNQDLDALLVGARIERNEEKENPLDFVLWKKTDEGIAWDSPWSRGRPGWHTECVVMIHHEFGRHKIDIHGGGQDLRFPHHENEAAQNKAIHHHDLANYWVHNAMLNIDGEKMSKSLGNVHWAKDFIQSLGSNVTRWLLLSTHYRLILNVTDDLIQQSQKSILRIENVLRQASILLQKEGVSLCEESVDELYQAFLEELYDDLNIANAQSILFENVKGLNTAIRSQDLEKVANLYLSLLSMVDVLGLSFEMPELTEEDRSLFREWEALKAAKDFEKADDIRDRLMKKGLL